MKGFANHRRIEIMETLDASPGLSLTEISQELGIDFRTAEEHTSRLVASGVAGKYPQGRNVRHYLTKLGKEVLTFVRTLGQHLNTVQ